MSIESALSYISSDVRETWVAMGMAVKSELGEAGFDVWDRWSRQSDRYKEADAKAVWRSMRGHGVTVRSLYHEARANGWSGEEAPSFAPRIDRTTEDAALAHRRHQAARRAAEIVYLCRMEQHAYLSSKGFKEAKGLVWWAGEEDNRLIIPMHVGGRLVNVQQINRQCEKKFLYGGQAAFAEHIFDAKGVDVLVEGYATGLSVRMALEALRMKYRIHVTFSAGNMVKVGKRLRSGVVIADNDVSRTGQRSAELIGWPYWMSEAEGEDANDCHRRLGLFRFSQALRSVFRQ